MPQQKFLEHLTEEMQKRPHVAGFVDLTKWCVPVWCALFHTNALLYVWF